MTLGYRGSGHQGPQAGGIRVAVPGSAKPVRGFGEPHGNPTGIPRTKRHTPVHLLCVLKILKIAGQQRQCA
jgi:hypothetical protein